MELFSRENKTNSVELWSYFLHPLVDIENITRDLSLMKSEI